MASLDDDPVPLVSVITPCYNAAPFVGETIASVAAQSYAPVEHIVVDDGSTDGSWDVIAEWAEAGRVRALRLPVNRGGGYARNRGAALARGSYLMFLDADDLLAPTALATLTAVIRDEPHAIAAGRWERLRQIAGRWMTAPAEIPFPPPADPLLGWLTGVWVPPCAVLWRRDAFERTGGWDEALVVNQDGDVTMRALARGVRVLVSGGETVAWYRTHGGSRTVVSTSSYSRAWLESQARVNEKLAVEVARLEGSARYTARIGFRFHWLGVAALHLGHADVARACFRAAARHAEPRALAPTHVGRVLLRVLGLERKERVAAGLARLGAATGLRRRMLAGYEHAPERATARAGASSAARSDPRPGGVA